MKQELIHVGAIVNAHGIRGEVKLNPVGFDPEFLAEFDRFNIGGKETEVRSSRVHKSVLLLTLPGIAGAAAVLVPYVKSNLRSGGDILAVLSRLLRLMKRPLPWAQLGLLAVALLLLYVPFCAARKLRRPEAQARPSRSRP